MRASFFFTLVALSLSSAACSASTPAATPGNDAGPQDSAPPPYDAGPAEPTTIAGGLTYASALLPAGGSVYWVQNAGGKTPALANAIFRVPLTGGAPTAVLTPTTGYVAGALASDGTSLYYGLELTPAEAGMPDDVQLMKCGLDGGNPTVVATNLPPGTLDALFVVGGVLYAHSGTGLSTAPLDAPGSPATSLRVPGPVQGLYAADTTGLYYSVVSTEPSILYYAPPGFDFYASPLDDSSANLLEDVMMDGGAFTFGGAAVAAGTEYLALTIGTQGTILQMPTGAPADGGAAVPFASFTEWSPTAIVADAKDMYVVQQDPNNAANPPGIYSVSTTTMQPTLVHATPFGAYGLALDANDLYWFEDTSSYVEVTLHATAR